MHKLNNEFNGKLDLAIQIFKDEYSKSYLHQLVSSQLDMDRMDYLNRDSFTQEFKKELLEQNELLICWT